MELRPNTDGLTVTVLVTQDSLWLEEPLRPLIQSGKINFINADANPDLVAQSGLNRDELDGPVAIISRDGEAQGNYCVISQIGTSIIAHCEDQVVPLTL